MENIKQIAKGDIVIFRGAPVRVLSIDHVAGSALVQFGTRQYVVNVTDLR